MAESLRKIGVFVLLALGLVSVRATCDSCQETNSFACHSATTYSICVDGVATFDYVSCPAGYVCTNGKYVCYPETAAVVASCTRNNIIPIERTQCGVCASVNKLFSCMDEQTVVFCFGKDFPDPEAIAYCPEGTVCDLRNSNGFCTELTKALPSCKRSVTTTQTTEEIEPTKITSGEPNIPLPTTSELTTTSTENPTTTEKPTSIATTEKETRTTTTEEPTTIKTTTEELSTITTEQPTTTTTTTEGSTTITEKSTTTTSTTKEPIKITTTEESTTTTEESTTTTEESTTTTEESKPTTTTKKSTTTTVSTTEEPTTVSTTEKPTTVTTTEKPTTVTTTEKPTTTTTTEKPTTSTTTEKPTTTTERPKTAAEICEEKKKNSQFVDPKDTDCTKYIVCFSYEGKWFAQPNTCTKGQFFNPSTAICDRNYVCPH